MIDKVKTPSQLVLEYYPEAKPVNKGKYYEIWVEASQTRPWSTYLGQGKSKKAAWKVAYNNNVR